MLDEQKSSQMLKNINSKICTYEPFNDKTCEFLNEVSSDLLKNKKNYPEIVSFAFWCRKSNINVLKKKYLDNSFRLGRGVVFHITPKNVAINFAYSFAFGLLSGNSNIVRVAQKNPVNKIIINSFNKIFNKKKFNSLKKSNKFIFYNKNSKITEIISKFCDARIIWGGDNTVNRIKQIPTKQFYSPTFNFKFSSKNKNLISRKFNNFNILSNLEKLLDTEIPLIKYNITSIERKFFDEANRLLPKNNYVGVSVTQGNEYRKKTWSINKFISVAKKIKDLNKQPVFFIEKQYSQLINKIKMEVRDVIFPEIDSHLSGPPLVTALSSKLEKAITIDNGVMHMMGLANIPMIILFGPTNSKKFAPKKNNINILDSKILYNSNDISKITEQDVLNLI